MVHTGTGPDRGTDVSPETTPVSHRHQRSVFTSSDSCSGPLRQPSSWCPRFRGSGTTYEVTGWSDMNSFRLSFYYTNS